MRNYLQIQYLLNLPGIGPKTIARKYKALLDNNSSVDEIEYEIIRSRPELERSTFAAKENAERAELKLNELLDRDGIRLLTIYDEGFPSNLRSLKSGTLFLYIKGNCQLLNQPNIAFIGTRNPSEHASIVERQAAREITNNTDLPIVSGLALGCDSIAHEACIESNHPTIAVLPCGFNHISPTQNIELANKILKSEGCLISEYPPNEDAQNYYFTDRDDVIAELSDTIYVAQCNNKSGTMHTVNSALKYGKRIACNVNYGDEIPYEGNEYILTQNNTYAIARPSDLIKVLDAKMTTCQPEQLSFNF